MVLDWLVANPDQLAVLLRLQQHRVIDPIVTAEVVHEIRRIPPNKETWRRALQDLIASHFVPVKPTVVPIAGIARAGLMVAATPRTIAFLHAMRALGLKRLDALHVTNAHFHDCAAFLTFDKHLLRKQEAISGETDLRLQVPQSWIL